MGRATPRIRHCAECPRCLTRYLIGFSPYSNRSYLVPIVSGSSDEYILYCSCGTPFTSSRWHWSEFKAYAVSKSAHDRGYGNAEEILETDIRVSAFTRGPSTNRNNASGAR